MMPNRSITCPRCGSSVHIPLYWALGIEGIFRCRECRLRFKTGYRMGAVLSAMALVISMALMQVMVFLLGAFTLSLFVLALVPVWLILAFYLRRAYMCAKMRRGVRRERNAERNAAKCAETPPEPITTRSYADDDSDDDSVPYTSRSLPSDTSFD